MPAFRIACVSAALLVAAAAPSAHAQLSAPTDGLGFLFTGLPALPGLPGIPGLSASSTDRGCVWISDTRNSFLPETHALYYRADVARLRATGSYIRIRGRYADARYASFQLYSGAALRSVATLPDYQVQPEAGAQNPAISRSGLDPAIAPGGRYEITVRFSAPPAVPAANTLYAGSELGDYTMTLRYYLAGLNSPTPDIVMINPDGSETAFGTPQDSDRCANQARSIAFGSQINGAVPNGGALFTPAGSAVPDQPFEVYFGGGIAQNQDARYLSTVVSRTARYVLVRGRAPSTPAYRPSPAPDLRYWSICSYLRLRESVVGCVADHEARIGEDGFFSIVLTAGIVPLDPATSAQFSVLGMGSESETWIIQRQLLDNPAFVGSANRVVQGQNTTAVIGDYAPVARSCAAATFNAAVAAGKRAAEVWDACAAGG